MKLPAARLKKALLNPPTASQGKRGRLALVAAVSPLARDGVATVLSSSGWNVVKSSQLPQPASGVAAYDLIFTESLLLGPTPAKVIAHLAPERIVVLESEADPAETCALIAAGAALVLPANSSAIAFRMVAEVAACAYGARSNRGKSLPPRTAGLTPRQVDVLSLLGQGLSNLAIAHELGIAPGTAKLHVAAIFKHLGLRTEPRRPSMHATAAR